MTSFLKRSLFWTTAILAAILGPSIFSGSEPQGSTASTWKLGTPIVTYFAGPLLTDTVAKQMADGGWNLVWCYTEQQLDLAQRHGLRGQFVER